MNVKKLLLPLALLLPLTATAQSISPAQIEQFKQLPRAQQEALAERYGVDLDSLGSASRRSSQRPQQVNVVEPVNSITNQEREQARAKQKEDEEQAQAAKKIRK